VFCAACDPPILRGFVGAVPQRLTFVDNATAGANAVLRSLRWRARERIVIADHAYPGVKNAARFVADRHGLELVEARVPWLHASGQAAKCVFQPPFAVSAMMRS